MGQGFSKMEPEDYFGVGRGAIRIDNAAGGGVFCLLWGEPGVRLVLGFVLFRRRVLGSGWMQISGEHPHFCQTQRSSRVIGAIVAGQTAPGLKMETRGGGVETDRDYCWRLAVALAVRFLRASGAVKDQDSVRVGPADSWTAPEAIS